MSQFLSHMILSMGVLSVIGVGVVDINSFISLRLVVAV